ncbi:MAG: hypothetical protein ABI818_04375 [Acidobacteriota bacterium]
MARAFDITAAADAVRLDTKGDGNAAFTVSNVSGRRIRGRAKLVPADPAITGWLSLAGDVERDFPAGSTQVYTANIRVPADARPAAYTCRLDVVSVDNPDEETAQGPSVGFTVAPAVAPPPKSFALWLIPVVVLLLILGGLGFWLVRPRPKTPVVPATAPTAASFAGEWSTSFARVDLSQQGAKVTGKYWPHGTNTPVTVEGVVSDRTLSGSLANSATPTPFSIVLDAGNDTFRGTWGTSRKWCGHRGYPSDLPADCGFAGAWAFRTGAGLGVPFPITMALELTQRGEEVKGALTAEFVNQPGAAAARESFTGDLSGRLIGWTLEGQLQLHDAQQHPLTQRIRWTLMNQDFQQFQGTNFALLVPEQQRVVTSFEDTCGARKGSPLPQPCRDGSGVVLDSFELRAAPGTDMWDALDNAPTQAVQLVGGDFRATVAASAPTTTHVQVVGFGVREPGDGKNVWLRITKGFSTDFNPPALISVAMRPPAVALLEPHLPFSPETPRPPEVVRIVQRGRRGLPLDPRILDGPLLQIHPRPRPPQAQGARLLQPVVPYNADRVQFMIERRGDLFTLSYSADGTQWTPVQRELAFHMSNSLEIFAVVYSNFNQLPITAQFTNLTIVQP